MDGKRDLLERRAEHPKGTVAREGSGANVMPTNADMVSTIEEPVIAIPRHIESTRTFFFVGSEDPGSDAYKVFTYLLFREHHGNNHALA